MVGSSNELNTGRQIRSFSLPSKSNLVNKRIEEELEKLKIKEASSTSATETINIGLSGLADLYSCINQVLSLPLTQQALSMRTHEKCVGQLLKVCSNLQNFASTTKEIVLQQKKLTGDLLSALSARNEGSTSTHYERKMASYISSRKDVIKRAKGLTLPLKQLLNDGSFGSPSLFHEDHWISPAICEIFTEEVEKLGKEFHSLMINKPRSYTVYVQKREKKTNSRQNPPTYKTQQNRLTNRRNGPGSNTR